MIITEKKWMELRLHGKAVKLADGTRIVITPLGEMKEVEVKPMKPGECVREGLS